MIQIIPNKSAPTNLIDDAIAVHGASRVLIKAIWAMVPSLRPKTRPPDADYLHPHLRKDLGLPPVPKRPEASLLHLL